MTPDLAELLREELERATAELKAHMASWEYAFAMGSGRDGGRNHPVHQQTRARTEELQRHCRDLKARLAEHEL
ncbi:MAG TPA: hypothetical protein VH231_18425 [Solirubrobacteraceae bacterium]|jgi:hypothetical protein|nr:hypothetical protein [Solirubrobacteraceae bacterium]